jgi:hypothetical protein
MPSNNGRIQDASDIAARYEDARRDRVEAGRIAEERLKEAQRQVRECVMEGHRDRNDAQEREERALSRLIEVLSDHVDSSLIAGNWVYTLCDSGHVIRRKALLGHNLTIPTLELDDPDDPQWDEAVVLDADPCLEAPAGTLLLPIESTDI